MFVARARRGSRLTYRLWRRPVASLVIASLIWGFPKIGHTPKIDGLWYFMIENPIKNGWFGSTPISGKPPYTCKFETLERFEGSWTCSQGDVSSKSDWVRRYDLARCWCCVEEKRGAQFMPSNLMICCSRERFPGGNPSWSSYSCQILCVSGESMFVQTKTETNKQKQTHAYLKQPSDSHGDIDPW